jgi:hypothetical protein
MREKQKKKANPFLIFTILFLVGIIAAFIIKTIYFTPKESIITIDENPPKTTIKTEKDATEIKPISEEDKKATYRKNWKDFISIGMLHKDVEYVVSQDGRITNLVVPIINKTEFPIESITIKVYYIDPTNKNTLESSSFEVKNVLPGTHATYPGPDSKVNGGAVHCEIIKMRSANFGFCFDEDLLIDAGTKGGFSGNPTDPWNCK